MSKSEKQRLRRKSKSTPVSHKPEGGIRQAGLPDVVFQSLPEPEDEEYFGRDVVLMGATYPVARKEYVCWNCRKVIEVGQQYQRGQFIDKTLGTNGKYVTSFCCQSCDENFGPRDPSPWKDGV